MNVLVVDDEALVSQYVTQCIREADPSVQIIGTASSGAKALAMLEKTPADLIFADITMPKMDGLELLRRIKAEHPAATVVMLTCHDEFEYARQAIQNKADGYMLKSEISAERMRQALEEAGALWKERRLEQQTGQLKQNDYLRRIMEEEDGVCVVTEENLRKNNIFLRDGGFAALCFENEDGNLQTVLSNVEADYENPVVYPYSGDLTVLLLNLRRTGRQWDTFEDLYREMDAYFLGIEARLKGRLGHSRMFFRIAWLGTAIKEALESHNDRFYGSAAPEDREGYGLRTKRLQKLAAQAALHIEAQSFGAARASLEEALSYARESHADAAALKRACGQICAALEEHCGAELPGCRQRLEEAPDLETLEGGAALLLGALESRGKQYSAAIAGALAYIGRHYAEDLTLNTVADHVFLNREYLSRRFKQEVGVTFSEYLTSVRLKRARELLETTGLRISEVASQTGIPNVSYFSTIFRKEFGCSPSEIRAKKNGKS